MVDATRSTSEVIDEIIEVCNTHAGISIGEFVDILGSRGFCLVILIFSLPNSLPVPGIPGFSTVTGIPIMLIALQMMLGREILWLPEFAAKKTFSSMGVARMLAKAQPWVRKLEKLLHPRMVWMRNLPVRCLLGAVFLLLSFMIALPVPGGNFLPGLSMSLIALAVLQRDGLFLLLALLFALGSSWFMYAVIVEFFNWFLSLLQHA
ncbi:MAG: exopolysaccharide biosynthesis protein [Alphaproteobacteria bacterium]